MSGESSRARPGGTLVLLAYLRSPRSLLRLGLAGVRLRWALFRDILRVGLIGAVSTVLVDGVPASDPARSLDGAARIDVLPRFAGG